MRTRRLQPAFEPLEPRTFFAVVTVDAAQVVRAVNPHVLGVNLTWWDTQLPTARTKQMTQAAGLNFFRFPGGSSSNSEHFNNPPAYNGRGTAATFANFIASVGGQGVATLNYGTASPEEGAAMLAYFNARPSDASVIGMGQQWVGGDDGAWVQKDWRTAGYWAGLRAAAPVTPNDGLNFLRVGRAAPFGLHYFEVGNEMYGTWEVDRHGQGGDPGLPHDPVTYAGFAKRFADLAAQIDPTISIGIDSGAVGTDTGWTARVLRAGQALGFVPDFISDHLYMQGPGNESDTYLLRNTVSNPAGQSATDPHHWGLRATGYRNLLNRNLGAAAAAGVELLATEYNSVYSNPGKQTTSLVNGLFAADSIGALLQTEYNGANFWDLRNGWGTGANNSASLYGWRQGGDYGMLGTGSGPAPSTGTYVAYPTYFAHQLASKAVLDGSAVVKATSDDPAVSAYAVRQAGGGIDLLVINKNPTANLASSFRLQGFRPKPNAHVWQYGKAEDTAQSLTTDGAGSLTSFDAALNVDGSTFSYTLPSYSMTVIELAAAPAEVVGRFTFYNRSGFDGNNSAPTSADDAAIAPTKVALLPGRGAAMANITNYSRGVNGIIVDLAGAPAGGSISAADFVFETGDGATWTPVGPDPAIARRPDAGAPGIDRITLALPDGTAKNAWLRVTVKATANTGLAAPDVFYFGNLAGDAGGPPPVVNTTDLVRTRAAVGATAATLLNPFDFNRDGTVNGADVLIARVNLGRSLHLFTPPATMTAAANPMATASEPALVAGPAPRERQPARRSLWDETFSPGPA